MEGWLAKGPTDGSLPSATVRDPNEAVLCGPVR